MAHDNGVIGINARSPEIGAVQPNVAGNPLLVAGLEREGYETVFIPRSNYSLEDRDVPTATAYAARLAADGSGLLIAETPKIIAVGAGDDRINVVRTRVAAPAGLDGLVPVVNGRDLRALGANKWEQYQLLRDHMTATVLATDDPRANDALIASLPTERVVVKGVRSQDSNWLAVVDKTQAVATIAEMRSDMARRGRSDAGIIVQAYEPGVQFDMLRGLSWVEDAVLARMPKDVRTELRMYCFVSNGTLGPQLEVYGVYRAFIGQEWEQFLAIDQESIPPEAFWLAEEVIDTILHSRRGHGGLIAIDQIRLPNGGLGVREINTLDPVLATDAGINVELHRQQIARLTRLLVRLAQGR